MEPKNKSIMFTSEQYAVIVEVRDKLSREVNIKNVTLGEAATYAARQMLKQPSVRETGAR